MVYSNLVPCLWAYFKRYKLEVSVALLIIAGRFGFISQETTNIPRFFSLSTVFTVIILFVIWRQRQAAIKPHFRFQAKVPAIINGCLAGYILLTLLWSPSTIYGVDKAVNFFFYVFLVTAMLLQTDFDPVAFAVAFHGVAAAVALNAFVSNLLGMSWGGIKAPGIGFGVNTFARLMVFGILINIGLLLYKPYNNKWVERAFLVFLALMFCLLFATISRGSIIGLSVCLLLAFLFVIPRSKIMNAVKFAACVVPLIVLYLWLNGTSDYFAHRHSLLIAPDQGKSINVRKSNISESLRYVMSGGEHYIVGYGSGAFPKLVLHKDKIDYPHNLFIELLLEYGVIGLLLVVTFILWVLIKCLSLLKEKAAYLPKMLMLCFLFSLITAQVSGDIFDNRFIWWFGIIFLISADKPALRRNTDWK